MRKRFGALGEKALKFGVLVRALTLSSQEKSKTRMRLTSCGTGLSVRGIRIPICKLEGVLG